MTASRSSLTNPFHSQLSSCSGPRSALRGEDTPQAALTDYSQSSPGACFTSFVSLMVFSLLSPLLLAHFSSSPLPQSLFFPCAHAPPTIVLSPSSTMTLTVTFAYYFLILSCTLGSLHSTYKNTKIGLPTEVFFF